MTEEQETSGQPAAQPAGQPAAQPAGEPASQPAGSPSATQRSRALNEMPSGPPGEPRARSAGPGKAYSPGGPQVGLGGPLSADEVDTVEEALKELRALREAVQDKK